MHISETKRFYNVIPSIHYFYAKTKMLADFQICISIPYSLKAMFFSRTEVKESKFIIDNNDSLISQCQGIQYDSANK